MRANDFEKTLSIYSGMLSSQNLSVSRSSSAETAFYDKSAKAIVLPVFASSVGKIAEISLVTHEAAHALFSEDLLEKMEELREKYSFALINALEDVYAESKIKEAFPGTAKIMREGYRELYSIGLFGLEGKELSKLSFLDRINLRFKIGHVVKIPFSPLEEEIVELISLMRTRGQFYAILEELSKIFEKTADEGGSSLVSREIIQKGNEAGEGEGCFCETQEIFNSALKSLSMAKLFPPVHSSFVVSYDSRKIAKECAKIPRGIEQWKKAKEDKAPQGNPPPASRKFESFVKSAGSIIAAKFSNMKSAESLAKSFRAKSGSLDPAKLRDWKTNPDSIFKKQIRQPNQQSHAVSFMLDMSSSMKNQLASLLLQVGSALEFCKALSIPFDVFAFSSFIPYPYCKKLCDSSDYDLSFFSKSFNSCFEGFRGLMKDFWGYGAMTPFEMAMLVSMEALKKRKAEGIDRLINFFFTDGVANFSHAAEMRGKPGFEFSKRDGDQPGMPRGVSGVAVNGVEYSSESFYSQDKNQFASSAHLPIFKYLKDYAGVDTLFMLYDSSPSLELSKFYMGMIDPKLFEGCSEPAPWKPHLANCKNPSKTFSSPHRAVFIEPSKLFSAGSIFVEARHSKDVSSLFKKGKTISRYYTRTALKDRFEAGGISFSKFESEIKPLLWAELKGFSKIIAEKIAGFIA
jgi:hypothetical protein